MIYRIKLAAMGLLCASTAAQGMEIQNWGYKARDRGCVGYFLPKQDIPKQYPYFLPEKDNSESKRSFSDELLFAKTMEAEEILPKDVTDQILGWAYVTEKTLDPQMMYHLEAFKVNKLDFLCLPMKSKRALIYARVHVSHKTHVLDNRLPGLELKIEGRDKEFAQKMSQYILDLPLPIRKELARKTGGYMVCNTKYEPSIYNTLLGETNNECHANKLRLARLAKIATAGALTLGGISVLATTDLPKDEHNAALGVTIGAGCSVLYSTVKCIYAPDISVQDDAKMNCVLGVVRTPIVAVGIGIMDTRNGVSIKDSMRRFAPSGLGIVAGVVAAEGVGLYAHNKVEDFLQESLEERDMRLGFEKIFLLKDDEK